MIIRTASEDDVSGLVALAGQVEHWFGPMSREPGFHAALARHIGRGTALVATADESLAATADADAHAPAHAADGVLGGLLFTAKPPCYHVRWLVVDERVRGAGIGRGLLAEAMHRFVTGPGVVEVVTFGADHPGASASGARVFYERLGFIPAEAAPPGPEGGSRQTYRKVIT
ncbi:MAG TPA: GNAT family N-acetyltransferase [Streptosporangiaceae bacterium]